MVNVSARTVYAIQAMLTLAASPGDAPTTLDTIAAAQDLPRKFLEAILADLRRGGLVTSVRGARGGYILAHGAEDITIGDVMRAVDGPLWEVHGLRPQDTSYSGLAQHLPVVWVAIRASVRDVVDRTSLAEVLSGDLPAHVRALAEQPDAWHNR